MARVHLLDDELINKIAAGEVVERPASVVKELVENAIDAGATHIKVCLKDGGRLLIQVSDDGLGMEAEDALLAIKRHATSKLSRADDLFQVSTMGFRGEALASIASVSRFTMQTQARGSDVGLRLVLEEGQVQSMPWSGSSGTTTTVADLFYNVPARKAFMKTGAAEFAACHEYMQALALSLPQIGFALFHNDREILNVHPLLLCDDGRRGEKALRKRVEDVLGADFAEALIYIFSQDRYAKIEGLISAPGQDKSSAKYMFSFVNHRWVRDKVLRYGMLRGYHSHLLKGRFPATFLHIDIDAALVDVNVHPAKAELRFQYGNEVQNAIAAAIRTGLRQGSWAEAPASYSHESLSPSARELGRPTGVTPQRTYNAVVPEDFDLLLGSEAQPKIQVDVSPVEDRRADITDAVRGQLGTPGPKDDTRILERDTPEPRSGRSKGVRISGELEAAPKVDLRIRQTIMSFDPPLESAMKARPPAPVADPIDSKSSMTSRTMLPQAAVLSNGKVIQEELSGRQPGSSDSIPWEELHFIGSFGRCFLLFEYQQQLLALDQHAFHERILYERFVQNPQLLKSSQPLLMPEVIEFRPSEIIHLEGKREHFANLGLIYKVLNASEVEVLAVPSLLVNKDLSSLMQALLMGADQSREFMHDHLATLACHAAVRAGEEIPTAELKSLLREAQTVDFYHNCPHGRRVFRWWKHSQVAAWFDRLG